MKALHLSKMSVIVFQLTWCSVSEDLNLHCTVFLYRSIQMKHIFSAKNRHMSRVLSSSTWQVNPYWLPLSWPCHLLKCTAVRFGVHPRWCFIKFLAQFWLLWFAVWTSNERSPDPFHCFTYQWLAEAPTLAMQPFITKLSHRSLTVLS
jgi:hypothetical protein